MEGITSMEFDYIKNKTSKQAHLINDHTNLVCLCCLNRVKGIEVVNFVDNHDTAVCPLCKIDCLFIEDEPLTDGELFEVNEHLFYDNMPVPDIHEYKYLSVADEAIIIMDSNGYILTVYIKDEAIDIFGDFNDMEENDNE